MYPLKPLPLAVLAALAAVTATGCRKHTVQVTPNQIPHPESTTPTPPPAGTPPAPGTAPPPTSPSTPVPPRTLVSAAPRVRVIHGSPGAPAVDIYVNNKEAIANLAYKAATAYTVLPASTVSARVTPAGSQVTIIGPADLTFDSGRDYTLIAAGSVLSSFVLVDDNTAPAAEKAKVRVVHAASDAPALDVLLDDRVFLANLAFGRAAGAYAQLAAGVYQVKVVPARAAPGAAPLLGPVPLTLHPGKIYTIVVMGKAADKTLNVQVYTDN